MFTPTVSIESVISLTVFIPVGYEIPALKRNVISLPIINYLILLKSIK